MEEKKEQVEIQKLDMDDLEQAAGGAIWYDALAAAKGVRRRQEKDNPPEPDPVKKQGVVSDAISGISSGAGKIKERLDKIARH